MQDRFYRRINLFDTLMLGFEIDAQTLKWWREQAPAAQQEHHLGTWAIQDALHELRPFVGEAKLWARGPQFDLALLDEARCKLGLKPLWKYHAGRDVRTLAALCPGVKQPEPKLKHHACEDAVAQAQHVIDCYKALGKSLDKE